MHETLSPCFHKRCGRTATSIAGNVPSSLLAVGSAQEVEQYVTRLVDLCAVDGGFMLMSGAVIDDAKPETLEAMLETGRSWKG